MRNEDEIRALFGVEDGELLRWLGGEPTTTDATPKTSPGSARSAGVSGCTVSASIRKQTRTKVDFWWEPDDLTLLYRPEGPSAYPSRGASLWSVPGPEGRARRSSSGLEIEGNYPDWLESEGS
jgi:hypothetical protein